MSARTTAIRKKLSKASLTWISRIIRVFASLVPYRLGVRLGSMLGLLVYYLLPRERKRTLTHLSLAFPKEKPDRIRFLARRCFMHLGKSLLEAMLMNPRRLAKTVSVQGEESLRNALSRGKGVVLVTGHIGNWEVLGQKLATLSPISVIAATIEPEQVNAMILELRARMGIRTILRGKPGSSRELIRIFKENRILGLLIDQDTDVESAFVDFMGMPARTPTAAASIAVKFGAPVVFGYIHRGEDNRHTVVMEGPLELVRTGNVENDIITNTAIFTKKIEEAIMKNPEQWVWMHRRWRRQP